MSILGRGLESLIPKKDAPAADAAALDVLEGQLRMRERVYRFHDEEAASRDLALDSGDATAAAFTIAPSLRMDAVDAGIRRGESIFSIDVLKIEPNPYQPRRTFNVEELTSLANSIREHGVIQPLIVTKIELETPRGIDVRYQLISGERRWRASKIAGLREVPVIVRAADTPERTKLELALIENVQREDLNPLERASAFRKLVEEFNLMHRDIAERIGKSREYVSNSFRLLALPSDIQTAIADGSITEGHARVILMMPDESSQRSLFQQIIATSLNVRDATIAARALGGARLRGRTSGRRSVSGVDPDARALERQLEEALGTRVSLIKRGNHGKIIVEFYSDEELRGILDRINRREEGYV